MHRIVVLLLLCCLCPFAHAKGSHSGHHHSKSEKSPKAKKEKANRTVHVKGYTRKDGTYVAPYDRSAPGTATASVGNASGTSGTYYRKDHMAEGFTPDSTVVRDKLGKIKRSKAARNEFQREHPCPSTGSTSGRCPGYVVDHIKALECGGADASSNMQWQTTAYARA